MARTMEMTAVRGAGWRHALKQWANALADMMDRRGKTGSRRWMFWMVWRPTTRIYVTATRTRSPCTAFRLRSAVTEYRNPKTYAAARNALSRASRMGIQRDEGSAGAQAPWGA